VTVFDTNKTAWDRMAARGSRFARIATDEECLHPLQTLDGRGWLPASVHGLDVLCLAAGGGWQSVLYAEMLRQDIEQARRRNVSVQVFERSMHDLSVFSDASFDIVHQPVSTCYVPDVTAVYGEVARVLRDGGLYISQHKQPTSLQIVERDACNRYVVGVKYYHQGPLPPVGDNSYREAGTVEFLHRWEDLVGGLCRAGLLIEDLREPCRADESAVPGEFGHRGQFVPPYVRLKARRVSRGANAAPAPMLWVP
jgi:SAM-dependent methyltransferase